MTKHETILATNSKSTSENQNLLDQQNSIQEQSASIKQDVTELSTQGDNLKGDSGIIFANDNSRAEKASKADNKTNTTKSEELHPFVYWAQSQTHIILRVDLIQVQDLKVEIDKDDHKQLIFSAKGRGAQGLQDYHFKLDFFNEVDPELDCHRLERNVTLLIRKSIQPLRWSRLTRLKAKLPWLRVNFDLYAEDGSDDYSDSGSNDDAYVNEDSELDDHESDTELYREQETKQKLQNTDSYEKKSQSDSLSSIFEGNKKDNRSIKNPNTDIFNPFNKYKTINEKSRDCTNMKYDYRKDGSSRGAVDNGKNSAKQLNYKKTYLFLYNLIMFVMFLKVYIVLIIKLSNGSMDDEILQSVAFIIRMLTYTQLLETIHPMLKLVPGGPLTPFTQVIGRILVNYFLIDRVIRLDSAPYAHYLFIVWSSIEIVRYPFYALRVFKIDLYALTWCRYTLFLPLYPMGGLFESMVVLSTIKKYEKTGEYSIDLPNQANMSFNLPIFLKFYTYVLLGPTILHLMRYMWKQRSIQLKRKVD